jgi:tRNA (cmo5U34)-methyltransferase
VTVETTNLWRNADHALRYLASRDRIPHRVEGMGVLVELCREPATRVLDLGTGDGTLLALVLSAHTDATGVGVDFQPAMLERARERFAGDERVEVVAHDLDQPLPAALGRFDLVVSSFAIHHLAPGRQRTLYGEVLARLEPGGRFANLEHVASPTAALHGEFLDLLGTPRDQDDPSNQLVGVGTQLGWLRDLGFVDVDCFWKWRELALLGGRHPEPA